MSGNYGRSANIHRTSEVDSCTCLSSNVTNRIEQHFLSKIKQVWKLSVGCLTEKKYVKNEKSFSVKTDSELVKWTYVIWFPTKILFDFPSKVLIARDYLVVYTCQGTLLTWFCWCLSLVCGVDRVKSKIFHEKNTKPFRSVGFLDEILKSKSHQSISFNKKLDWERKNSEIKSNTNWHPSRSLWVKLMLNCAKTSA